MHYSHRYRLNPTVEQRERLLWTVDTCRQVYNHFLHRLNRVENTSKFNEQKELPKLKQWWTGLKDVCAMTLQLTVHRLYDNLSRLKDKKERGYKVGALKWKPPQEYRSFRYMQYGFELKNTSGRTALHLQNIGEIPVVYDRDVPDGATVKSVVVKREPTGRWFASLQLETDEGIPPKPRHPKRCVGIDVGILKFTHDTDGHAVESLDLSTEEDRLQHEQRVLSRKEHGSANYRTQQRKVARRHADIKQKRRDFLHKLSTWYAREYDLVAVEKLNVAGMMQFRSNSHNRASAAWGTFRQMLMWKCKREGTHFVEVRPHGTTKECAKCGVSTDKPLWVREHSCPACGFEADRDENAAWNVLSRGLNKLGMSCAESTSSESLRDSDVRTRASLSLTPSETAVPTDTSFQQVPANRVVEQGTPVLHEASAKARVG